MTVDDHLAPHWDRSTDGISQSSDQGLREVAGIGVVLLTTDKIAEALA